MDLVEITLINHMVWIINNLNSNLDLIHQCLNNLIKICKTNNHLINNKCINNNINQCNSNLNHLINKYKNN